MECRVKFYSDGVPLVGVLGLPDDLQPLQRRAAIVFCQGFALPKEIWMLDLARHFRELGYITLCFDYRSFGESGGEPRLRLVPQHQVCDIRSAITWLCGLPEVEPRNIGLYGTSFGGSHATSVAGLDARVCCAVSVAAPMDCERQFRWGSNFARFEARVKEARASFVQDGKVTLSSVGWIMARDPDFVLHLEEVAQRYPTWEAKFSLESMVDILEYKPERYAPYISPCAMLWVYGGVDMLVPEYEGRSVFAKAREPRELVVLSGLGHRDVHGGSGTRQVMELARAWFERYMPVR